MKTLPTEFKKWGSDFQQIERGDSAAIYERTDKYGLKTYEVICPSIQKTMAKKGDWKIEPGEYYPSNEQWGSTAWTFTNLKTAKEKFTSLTEKPYKPR